MIARQTSTSFALRLAAGSLLACAVASGCGGSSATPPGTSAQAESTGASGEHHHMPPPAAFDACKGRAVDEACTVQLPDREITGKCAEPPPGSSQNAPACRPEGGPRHRGHHGPPPEKVFAACDGKAAGDECSVVFERGTVQGSCMAPRHDAGTERLLCAPAHSHKGGK
jgi:hypothetical protein